MTDFIRENYDRIYRYCFYKLHSRTIAEDITQETFLRYFKSGDKGIAYAFAIAKNLIADHFRSPSDEPLDTDIAEDDFSDVSDVSVDVRRALDSLAEKDRELLLLRYSCCYTVNETAKILGISRFALYRAERAALEKMKKMLGDDFL